MLWWIGPITAGIAVFRLFSAGATALAWIAVVVLLAGVWTAGIAANFRGGQEGAIPDTAVIVNLIATVGGIALLVASFFV